MGIVENCDNLCRKLLSLCFNILEFIVNCNNLSWDHQIIYASFYLFLLVCMLFCISYTLLTQCHFISAFNLALWLFAWLATILAISLTTINIEFINALMHFNIFLYMIRNMSIEFIELITRLYFLYIFSYSMLKISHISDFVMLYFSVSCTSWKIYENFQFSLPNVFTWTLEWMSTVFSSNVTGLSQRLLGVHWGAEGLYLIIIVLVSC